MKIAVTYDNGNVFQHFGHTESFKVYKVEDGVITGMEIIETTGNGHCGLADMLRDNGICTLICGGIGAGAKSALAEAGIKLYGGVSGDTDQAVNDLLADKLNYNPDLTCDHHGEHHHEEMCGGHDHKCSHQ